ncbi:MAG: hypothetical protein E7585_01830 [Ruminococcaceae bacterium]|nr:hypothetical protein [Oscillospiraceae bacterium]
MKQIDKIRAMSAEELAEFLLDVDQQNFSVTFCEERFCPDLASACTDEKCLMAAVAYLESEVPEK